MLEIIIVSAIVICAVIAVVVLVMVLRSAHTSDNKNSSVAVVEPNNKPQPEAKRISEYEALSDEVEQTKVLNAGHRINNAGLPIRLKNLKTSRSYSLIVCPEMMIGRMEVDGVFMIKDDSAVSKKHCRLYMDGNKLWIEDLNSANHTFVNGQRIDSPVLLQSGDEIKAGNSRLMIFF